MKICASKLDTALARQCKNAKDLKGVASLTTLQRIRDGHDVKPKTAGRIAQALNIDVAELLYVVNADR